MSALYNYYRLKIQEKCVCGGGGGGDESLPKENDIDHYCCPLIRINCLPTPLVIRLRWTYVMNSF